MNIRVKFLSIMLCFLLILIPTTVKSQDLSLNGQVSSLKIGQKAPYAGILLDPVAAAKMIVDKKYIQIELELSLRKEFAKQLADKRLAFDLLKVEHDSLKKIHVETVKLRDKQISSLETALKNEMGKGDNREWWLAGGVLIGIALSIAVFYASVEVVNK